MIKISIIMPIYNMESFLDRSINSVLLQSMEEIELICIDDSSTDSSVNKVQWYVERDKRVRLLQNSTRKSALQARKRGILEARGKYILFIDADDYFEQGAFSTLYEKMESFQVDVLHFPSIIENEGVTLKRQKNMESFVKPYCGELAGEDIFVKCFENQWYQFSVWNKIYRTEVCKSAMAAIEDDFLLKANDLILYTAISLVAKSYKGVDGEPLYHYSFGSGSTGSSDLTLEKFEVYCYEAKAAGMFRQIVEKSKAGRDFTTIIQQVKERLLGDSIYNWKVNLTDDKAAAGLDLLMHYWGTEDTIAGLAEAYSTNRTALAARVYGAKCLHTKKHSIKTLGIYYHRMGKGGVQRVISLLLPVYLELGYEVILFTDEYEPKDEYYIPESVKRIILPSALTIQYAEYNIRARELSKGIEEYGVDMMLYQAAECRTLLYDMLLIKAKGIPFLISIHGLFSAEMLNSNAKISEKLRSFQLADRLVVLSETEKTFWEIFGIPVTYIPNPIQRIGKTRTSEDYILWMARLESVQKQHMDAVEILNKVVKVYPQVKMKIVGSEVTHNAKKNMLKRIAALKLEENIEVCDYTTDVESMYEHAQIFLMTSSFESFAMTVVESKGYGIPLVTYALPYLETLKDQKGYISVPQGDVESAAKVIVELLENKELRDKLSKEARESYESLREYPLKEAWSEVIRGVVTGLSEAPPRYLEREKVELVMKTLLEHYQKGAERLKTQHHLLQMGKAEKAVTLQYIEPKDTDGKVRGLYVKTHNLYVHYRKHGAGEAWRVIKNKLRK